MKPSPGLAEAARLFNARSYYEAHDVLEEDWADARGREREALKALVKLAAGMYHLQTSGFRGAESLLASGLEALDALPPEAVPVMLTPLVGPASRCLAKLRQQRIGEDIEWDQGDVPRLELLIPRPGA